MATTLVRCREIVRKVSVIALKNQFDNCMSQGLRAQSTVARSLIYPEYGDPSKVIQQLEQPLAAPKDNEVVLRMLAAPVNPADINTIQGAYPLKPPLPAVAGNEGVGEVVAAGSAVKALCVGDRVVPKHTGWGTWRTHALCREDDLIKISKKLGIVEAATLTVNPCTAYRMLKDFVKLKPGDTVIQNAGNSACGQYVIQLCKVWGLRSINIVRNRAKLDELKCFLTELGATYVITEEETKKLDLFKSGKEPKPKLALNAVGGKNAMEMLRHLDNGGYMVTYGGMSREPVMLPTSAMTMVLALAMALAACLVGEAQAAAAKGRKPFTHPDHPDLPQPIQAAEPCNVKRLPCVPVYTEEGARRLAELGYMGQVAVVPSFLEDELPPSPAPPPPAATKRKTPCRRRGDCRRKQKSQRRAPHHGAP